ncbi:class I SAM-dependent methyltransferase [Rhodococcus sp. HNM0563]|uniref:class I SAM-dependent methyltransferase n=1 Tax=Rhodococcus sp. HNM0563 TaxID=2716339 RepID=UPI00146B9B5D|nr:class I SAM-dependent methyltransferase [Rhodococcus sp. HNM0563]NLU61309.1 class I SAM-dependent methyltransferase [Rhodococcus sp. HNM0563]
MMQARSFGAAASAYRTGRPSYPSEAVRWLLPTGADRVLDLGAGSGQLTRSLIEHVPDIVAVEPSAGMREEFTLALPDTPVHAGSAEHIPLDDESVDAVLVAQAWHWVDPVLAVPEVARVLRSGGQLGLLWNVRDERVDWVAEMGEIMRTSEEIDMRTDNPIVGPPFAELERADFEWTFRLTRSGLLDLVASRSYIITMDPVSRAKVLARVEALVDSHPDLAGRDGIDLPYITRCSRTRKAITIEPPA